MTKYKVENKVEDCIGCGACAAICDNFEMVEINGEEKAKPKKEEIDESELETNKEAAESCPIEVIKITEKETGKKIV
ncbi:ferredoxin [archaeon]|nr:ferredoxin [archaeon]